MNAATAAAVERLDVTIRVDGKPFRCECGCNVFRELKGPPFLRYECNSCHARYTGSGISEEQP